MIYAVEVHSGRTMVEEIVAGDTQEAAINAALSRHPAGCVVKGVYPATNEQIRGSGSDPHGGPASLDDAMQLETRAEFEDAAVAMGMVIGSNWSDTMLRVAVMEQVALRRGGPLKVQYFVDDGSDDGTDRSSNDKLAGKVTELEREVDNLKAKVHHRDGTIEKRDQQIAELEAGNASLNARILELEELVPAEGPDAEGSDKPPPKGKK
jgi:hypothetical protein